jgi:nucleoid-associated protein YgaU
VKSRATVILIALVAGLAGFAFGAAEAFGATMAPLSGTWNIQTAGKPTSSGELLFRMTPGDGGDPVEITVSVIAGATEDAVARKIRTTLGSQLRGDRFDVQMGEGSNVIVSDTHGRPNFSLELVDSDVDNLRVTVQSATPVAPPTVPEHAVPATQPNSELPQSPAPEGAAPATAPPQTAPPQTAPPQTAPPAGAPGGAGAPASAAPPPPG